MRHGGARRAEEYSGENLVQSTHSCGVPLEEREQNAFFALKVKSKLLSLSLTLSLCGILPPPNRPDCYCLSLTSALGKHTTLTAESEFPSVVDYRCTYRIPRTCCFPWLHFERAFGYLLENRTRPVLLLSCICTPDFNVTVLVFVRLLFYIKTCAGL